jgi:hypothetical protein
MRNERELVDDLIDFARKPEARDLTRGHIEDRVDGEPGSGPPGLSHSRIERLASLRHANRPRVRRREFASGREAALAGGDEALGGLERLPFTRGKEGDPRASLPQGAATRSLSRPSGSGDPVMCRAGATHHCARVQLTCLSAAASGRVLSGSPLKPA